MCLRCVWPRLSPVLRVAPEPEEACANQFELMIRAVSMEEVQSSFERGSLSGKGFPWAFGAI